VKSKKPFCFFVPKNFALLDRYQEFWSLSDIFRQWSSAVKTHRDYLVVGFTKRKLLQKLRTFTGPLPDDVVAQTLDAIRLVSTKTKETAYLFPLHAVFEPRNYALFEDQDACVPNSSSKFTEALKGALDLLPPVEEVFNNYIYSYSEGQKGTQTVA